MSAESKDRLAAGAIIALTLISLVAIVGGIWSATVLDREIEGIVAIVAGAVAGIGGIVIRDRTEP